MMFQPPQGGMNPLILALLQQQAGSGAGAPQMGPGGPQMPTPMQRGAGGGMGMGGGMQGPQPPAPQPSPMAGMMGNPQMMAAIMAMRNQGAGASPGPQIGASAMPNGIGDFGSMSVDQLRKQGFGQQPSMMSWLSSLFGSGGSGG